MSGPIQYSRSTSSAAVAVKKTRRGKRAAQNSPAPKKLATGGLDYNLLLAKIIHYCHEYVPAEILATVDRHKPHAKTTPWITEWAQTATKYGGEKRYLVLDARTWRLTQYGTDWEAKSVAETTAGINAGNGVFIFCTSRVSSRSLFLLTTLTDKENPKWLLFMQGFNNDTRQTTKEFNARMKSQWDFFAPVRDPAFIKNELKEEMARMKEKAGVGNKNKNGSPLFLLVCGALERIREGKI